MNSPASLLKEEPPLSELTESIRRGAAVTWYRSPLTTAQVKDLHRKSNLQGAFQTLGYLGILLMTGTLAYHSSSAWPWWMTIVLILIHGTVGSFLINAVHELGHGTVFKTRWLNTFFCHLLAFPGWINHEMFQASHTRHHRYTLHPPDDLEVVLPSKIILRHFLRDGFINIHTPRQVLESTWRIACGRFSGEWEMTLFPPSSPGKRQAPVRWARILLGGHALILLLSIATGHWMIPLLVSMIPCYGAFLFYLCNNTQHVGLQDNVADFRLCARTYTLNPLVRFLYWQMNYHIEHHMYAAVPCYHLKKLHSLIRHDLPPTPQGLRAVWREIISILKRQEKDPAYQHAVTLPVPASGVA